MPPFQKWIWISGRKYTDKEDWKRKFDKLKILGFKGVLVSAGRAEDIGLLAKEFELDLHIWYMTVIKNDSELIKNHPDWYQISRNGEPCIEKPPYVGYYKWLCPSNEEVVSYLENKIKEFCQYEADGIHLDYIRYPDIFLPDALQTHYRIKQDRELPEYDYCYCDICRSKFKSMYDVDPLETTDTEMTQLWEQYRLDRINNLVSGIRRITNQNDKKLSAAVFPSPEMSRRMVRQQWDKWNLDAYFPMIYHNFYNKDLNWIKEITQEDVNSVGTRSEIISGVYVPKISPKDLKLVVRMAKDGGANGVCFFEEGNMSDEHWREMNELTHLI